MKPIFLILLFSITIFLYPQDSNQKSKEYVQEAYLSELMEQYDTALSYYRKATELDSLNYDIYESWVYLLRNLAEENPIYYLECGYVYEKMIKLVPDDAISHNDWGSCLLRLSKHLNNFKIFIPKAEYLFIKAESLSDQLGAYNLACLYSLINEKKKAFKWLEFALSKEYEITDDRITKNAIINESDFNNIKNTSQFNKILNKYFPET